MVISSRASVEQIGLRMSVTAISAFAPISSTAVPLGGTIASSALSPAGSGEARLLDQAALIEPAQGSSDKEQVVTVAYETSSNTPRTAIPESWLMLIERLDRVDLAHQALSRVRVQLTSTLEKIQKMNV
ncbi:MAG: hypothetical protein AAEJ65_10270 [Planctomycetota bacterium]